jgi:hypothetical protein
MPADPVLSSELTALREELARSRAERDRPAPPLRDTAPNRAPGEPDATSPPPNASAADQHEWARLEAFTNEIAGFFEQAEESVSEHPAESIVATLLLGIVIGCLLGRHQGL